MRYITQHVEVESIFAVYDNQLQQFVCDGGGVVFTFGEKDWAEAFCGVLNLGDKCK